MNDRYNSWRVVLLKRSMTFLSQANTQQQINTVEQVDESNIHPLMYDTEFPSIYLYLGTYIGTKVW